MALADEGKIHPITAYAHYMWFIWSICCNWMYFSTSRILKYTITTYRRLQLTKSDPARIISFYSWAVSFHHAWKGHLPTRMKIKQILPTGFANLPNILFKHDMVSYGPTIFVLDHYLKHWPNTMWLCGCDPPQKNISLCLCSHSLSFYPTIPTPVGIWGPKL